MGDKRMENTMNQQTVDFDLSLNTRKTIRIDGDDNRIIKLNTSDMGIIERIQQLSERMSELAKEFVKVKYDENLDEKESTDELVTQINKVDGEMRSIIDDLFQSPICDVCVPDGTMFDIHNGEFMYERLIDRLLTLYADTIQDETQKVITRMRKHIDKYIPQDHKKKS
jgi:hypothetical protein